MTAPGRRPGHSEPSPYRGCVIAVGTRHGKQHQWAPAFRDVLGAELLTPPDLDTDRLGTFTGETARKGPAVDAARAKTRLAMTIGDLSYGLASEASYGPLPGGWPGHEEILLFCDDLRGIEVLEVHRTPSLPGVSRRVGAFSEIPPAVLADLPDQALIVRPAGAAGDIVKGITDAGALRSAISAAARNSPDGLAIVEPDLRAHYNPSRRRVLVDLADRLARRLATTCPACEAPGFGRVGSEFGLPCRVCATPTPQIRSAVRGCAACAHRVCRPVPGLADPSDCPDCNP